MHRLCDVSGCLIYFCVLYLTLVHGCQADGSSRWGGLPRGGSGAEKG
ncbi:hypothetical protein GY514_002973 [Escherichia coli]|nr:hypothetical protein [Escherichia coli]EFI3660760.1 hypothetical protein [Escherichia coli]